MKKRYLYLLLFGIPGFFVSLIITVIFLGTTMGLFWIFIFGDNPWPSWVLKIIPIAIILIFFIAWIAIITTGFFTGKKLEQDQVLNKKHVWVSTDLTLAFILIIIFLQLRATNFGQKTDYELCADFCSQKGYAASWTSPAEDTGGRNCLCGNNFIKEDIKIPMDSIKRN